jgi:DNA-binding NtrC family response regulator
MLFAPDERRFATEIQHLVYVNPFLEERILAEQRALGDDYIASQPYWSFQFDLDRKSNIDRLDARANAIAEKLRGRVSPRDQELYTDLVTYVLYERYREQLVGIVERGEVRQRVAFYRQFRRDAESFGIGGDVAHLFACFFQVRRAFHSIFNSIVGRSQAAAKLRAAVWQSIFTHDMRRYRRALFSAMGDVTTLITGATGSGKEVVARAIGLSRYVAFDERTERFAGDTEKVFVSLNLSALSPTLIESELFGHRKGAFTGAIEDREGFLESCGAIGTVFLDEIGDVDPAIQVKLLRVIQSRTFQRLGETTPRRFSGKIIAATNRDLPHERFRDDFYYRLCADTIKTPALAEQFAGNEDELRHLVRFIAARVAGASEADAVCDEVCEAIEKSPGRGYAWPGNFRELEQCVRSVLVRGEYRPAAASRAGDARQRIANSVVEGHFTADDLLRNYCTLLYAKSRNYAHVADRLKIDRRTVKAKVDATLLRDL